MHIERKGPIMTTPNSPTALSPDARIARRAAALFARQKRRVARRTDRMFAVLMIAQWIAGVVIALMVTPEVWNGSTSRIHPHVIAAVLLGGAISGMPAFLALAYPGKWITRNVIAVAQML